MNNLITEILTDVERTRELPRYTSLHEAYSALARQVHTFFDAGREYLPGRRDPGAIRVEAVRIAALAVKAIEELRLESISEDPTPTTKPE